MKIHPTSNRVLIKALEADETLNSGIIIPESARDKKKSSIGTVVECGPEAMLFAPGDKVLYDGVMFEAVEADGDKYQIGKSEDIFAVLEDEQSSI